MLLLAVHSVRHCRRCRVRVHCWRRHCLWRCISRLQCLHRYRCHIHHHLLFLLFLLVHVSSLSAQCVRSFPLLPVAVRRRRLHFVSVLCSTHSSSSVCCPVTPFTQLRTTLFFVFFPSHVSRLLLTVAHRLLPLPPPPFLLTFFFFFLLLLLLVLLQPPAPPPPCCCCFTQFRNLVHSFHSPYPLLFLESTCTLLYFTRTTTPSRLRQQRTKSSNTAERGLIQNPARERRVTYSKSSKTQSARLIQNPAREREELFKIQQEREREEVFKIQQERERGGIQNPARE